MSPVTFLWYVINSGRIKADPEKIQAIVTLKQRKHFLGFASFYSCFIRDYSCDVGNHELLTV